jgi:hypothetical protein
MDTQDHWLCAKHRKRLGKKAVRSASTTEPKSRGHESTEPKETGPRGHESNESKESNESNEPKSLVTETHLLSALVFDFPTTTCRPDEARLRTRFAARVCTSPSRVRFVLRAYGIRGTRVVRGVEPRDAAVFFERLVRFICLFVPSSHARLVRVVERVFPTMARAHIECAERVLLAVERETGSPRAFFTRADLAPLAARIPLDLVETVHAAYLGLSWTSRSSVCLFV